MFSIYRVNTATDGRDTMAATEEAADGSLAALDLGQHGEAEMVTHLQELLARHTDQTTGVVDRDTLVQHIECSIRASAYALACRALWAGCTTEEAGDIVKRQMQRGNELVNGYFIDARN